MSDINAKFLPLALGLRLLNGISESEQADLVKALSPRFRTFNAGHAICVEGTPATCLFIVSDGTVDISRTHDGKQEFLKTRQGPAVIGEAAYLRSEQLRNATVQAKNTVDVWEIKFAHIEAKATDKAVARFVRNLGGIVADKLDEATAERAKVLQRDASRVVLLQKLANEYALGSQDGAYGIRTGHETRRAVIMFSDIVGFSDLAKALGPQKTAEILNNALASQASVIEGSGGHIDKFIGDAVMAFWVIDPDTPELVQQICAAASSAVIAANAAVSKITHPLDPEKKLQLRIGLHMGEVAIGNFGTDTRSAFTLIGDAVNYAARLEQARPTTVAVQPIRVSTELFKILPPDLQAHFPSPHEHVEKGMKLHFHH